MQNPPGTLALIKPLLGPVKLQKLRADGSPLGAEVSLDVGKGKPANETTLLLGGPSVRYFTLFGGVPAICLEVVLRPPGRSVSSDDIIKCPSLDMTGRDSNSNSNSKIGSFFRDTEHERALAEERTLTETEKGKKTPETLALATSLDLQSNVGGLEKQLNAIVRRVLASRSDPAAARALGISHVRGYPNPNPNPNPNTSANPNTALFSQFMQYTAQ